MTSQCISQSIFKRVHKKLSCAQRHHGSPLLSRIIKSNIFCTMNTFCCHCNAKHVPCQGIFIRSSSRQPRASTNRLSTTAGLCGMWKKRMWHQKCKSKRSTTSIISCSTYLKTSFGFITVQKYVFFVWAVLSLELQTLKNFNSLSNTKAYGMHKSI